MTESPVKVHSPIQVGVASFLGGPLAACWLMSRSFGAAGFQQKKRQWIAGGVIGTVCLIPIVIFLPEKFPNSAIPIGYTVGLYQIAKQQLSSASLDPIKTPAPWWIAIVAGIIGLIITFGLLLVVLLLLPHRA